MRMKSGVDWWLKILMLVSFALIAVSMAIVPKDERVIGYAVGFPMLAFLIWIYFDTYYELRENYLYCRSGPFFEKIYYDKIKSARLSENLLSSMALSRKRIEIRQHGKGYITGTTFISPIDRDEFLWELKNKCKCLEERT